jgi:hypothetical protein
MENVERLAKSWGLHQINPLRIIQCVRPCRREVCLAVTDPLANRFFKDFLSNGLSFEIAKTRQVSKMHQTALQLF